VNISRHIISTVVLFWLAAVGVAGHASDAAATATARQATSDTVAADRSGEQDGGRAAPQDAVELEPAPLSDFHREWLEQNVVYIITPHEEEVFEVLTSDEERDLFIERFWRVRDPTPGTTTNQLREEHDRRVEYASDQLGRETPRRGWQTDRGRTYIQLGEPADIGRYVDPKGFWPMEIWTYQVNARATGLPPFFYLMFYRPNMNGEYLLYDPFTDGPGRLAKSVELQMADTRTVVRTLLQNVGYEAAHASLSINASERPDFTGATSAAGNELVIAALGDAPTKGIDTSYTEVFLSHRGDVDASVFFDAMEVDMTTISFWDRRGMPHLHYAVQIPAQRIMLAEFEDDYYLSLAVSLAVADLRGEPVEDGGDTLEEHFDAQRANALIRSPLAYYDRLALVPGVYDVSVEVINRINDEGSLARARMSVPAASRDQVVLGDVLVASSMRRIERGLERAFQFEGWQYVPAAGGRVNAGAEVHLFAQLVAGTPTSPGDVVEVSGALIDAEGNEVEVISAAPIPPRPAPTPTPLNVSIPLTGVRPGPYTVRLTANLPDGQTLTREKSVEVLVAGSAPDPMVLLAGEIPVPETRDLQTRGLQSVRKSELNAAITYFRAGLDLDPNDIGTRRALAQTLYDAGDPAETVRTIGPLAQSPSSSSGDALLLSIALRAAGEPTGAAQTARVLLTRWQPTAAAYNALGDALLDLGQQTEAAQAFRDSLTLDPEQPEVRDKLARISGGGR